jgi:epoxyqueuosine reductase
LSTESVVKELSLKFFNDVGIARADKPNTIDIYSRWLDSGLHGKMNYLYRHLEKKSNPQLLLNNAKSWIVLPLHYDTQEELSTDKEAELRQNKRGWISRYARGLDYHDVIARKHEALIAELQKIFPDEQFLSCVDTKAVLERDVAGRAGMGWVGKNTCLIHPKKGSFFFLSEILTTLDLQTDKPIFDHCGTCTRCIEACPTQALEGPRQLNATKCISYWTIESKEAPPADLAKKFGVNIFGCDICQDVCPWNKKARKSISLPSEKESGEIDLRDFAKLSHIEIENRIKDKAINRVKPEKLRQNIIQALANCEK